jgi:hypothetical protein
VAEMQAQRLAVRLQSVIDELIATNGLLREVGYAASTPKQRMAAVWGRFR